MILTVTAKAAALQLLLSPPAVLECGPPLGSVVAAVATTGGDHKPITFSLSGTLAPYLKFSNNQIVVSAAIPTLLCGTTSELTVTASEK